MVGAWGSVGVQQTKLKKYLELDLEGPYMLCQRICMLYVILSTSTQMCRL